MIGICAETSCLLTNIGKNCLRLALIVAVNAFQRQHVLRKIALSGCDQAGWPTLISMTFLRIERPEMAGCGRYFGVAGI